MKKIGIFGGSFNPPHNGHINIVRQVSDLFGLSKVIVIPSYIPVHKENDGRVSARQRYEMCELAFRDVNAEVSDIEIRRKGKSYTYDTVTQLKKSVDGELYLIIGSDMLMIFESWYRYGDILNSVKVIAACRTSSAEELKNLKTKARQINDIYPKAVAVCEIEPFEASSTEIRRLSGNREDITSFVPKLVENYIIERRLYYD